MSTTSETRGSVGRKRSNRRDRPATDRRCRLRRLCFYRTYVSTDGVEYRCPASSTTSVPRFESDSVTVSWPRRTRCRFLRSQPDATDRSKFLEVFFLPSVSSSFRITRPPQQALTQSMFCNKLRKVTQGDDDDAPAMPIPVLFVSSLNDVFLSLFFSRCNATIELLSRIDLCDGND